MGAVAGAYLFGAGATSNSYPTVMVICAVLSILGSILTHFFVDDDRSVHRLSDSIHEADYCNSTSKFELDVEEEKLSYPPTADNE